jgi:hypothetical protein
MDMFAEMKAKKLRKSAAPALAPAAPAGPMDMFAEMKAKKLRKSAAPALAPAAPAPAPPQAPAPAPAPAPAVPAGPLQIFSYEELTVESNRLPAAVDPSAKEQHLSDSSFQQVFGISRGEFAKMPKWKRVNSKKKAGLH